MNQTSISRRKFIGQLSIGAAAMAANPFSLHAGSRPVVTGSPEKGAQWAKDYGFPGKNIYNYDELGRRDLAIIEATYTAAATGRRVQVKA